MPQESDHCIGREGKRVIRQSEHMSEVVGVCWCESDQAWIASWVDKGDKSHKNRKFYVKEHGFDKAKTLAEQHRREMERTGRAALKKRSEHQSGVKGVYYQKGNNAWVAHWRDSGKRKFKPFSVRDLGYEGAKQAAIPHRRAMEERHYDYWPATSPPPPSFELNDDSRPPIRTSKRRRNGTMDHSSTPDDTQPTDSNGQPADESASDIARLDATSDAAALAVVLEGVRASDPGSGGRYEIVTVTVAGQQTRAIRWLPTGVDVPSDGQVTAQAMRAGRPPREERSDWPLPLPHAEASTTAHRNDECTDPEERHTPSSSVDGHGGHNGRVASAARSPPPKLCGPADRQVAGELTGNALARALVRWMRDQQPGEFHAPDRGGIGISWRTNYSYEAYFWDNDASTTVDLRQFPVGYGASRAAIFTAFREAVEYRNALHRSRVGDRAMPIDLSWLQRAQQGQGQGGVPGVPPNRNSHLHGGNNRSKRPRLDPPLDSPLCPRPAPPAAPHLPARPRMSREGDATLDQRTRQRSSVARAARQSDQGGSESHDDGSRSSSPQPRRRPKAAKGDGASVSAGGVWSSICMSNPQWAADTDSKAGSKGKTVITKSVHQSDVAGVRWHEGNQAWRATWCEKGDPKQKEKYFYVKDHGFDRAKALAEQHRCELERTGRASVRKLSKHPSGVRGVWYNKGKNAWTASWHEGGKEKTKPFSIAELGYEGAKQAAIGHRRAMEAKHYRYQHKGETAAQ
ncbi:unnamed protein product [Vitrella brassicaformis CCMP3155]|uniref:AP2/ERF domain-containing protein n=1 Tax=Vitrella brassicaformis (strain CCMP3155) TaxID=1169540 RepID=A0A0G4G2Z5_VITBC|nr:unnamed protein product [Vitrella brassicaformis CCMP3155]|eukprot:CEM22594.1 unnamed protein product [Vitrella brassicaformis CCMP3155]